MTDTAPAPGSPEAALERIRGLMEQGDAAAALAAAEALAQHQPEHRDTIYTIAVCQRLLQRIPEALATLVRLQGLHPAFSRLYQERGYCRVALRDASGAIEAFLQAVHLNPALSASWSMLERLYRMVGDTPNATTAAEHVATLAALPPSIVTASSMFSDQDLDQAEQTVRAFLLAHGDHIEGMRLLARIGMQRDVLDDAEVLLTAVLERAPDYRPARFDYASVLLRRHRYQAALLELERLCEAEPDNRQYRTSLAAAWVGIGDHDKALAIYRDLADRTPSGADLRLSVGHCLKTLGRTDEAIAAYREAASIRPAFGDAYWSLANLKTYRFDEEQIAAMQQALTRADATVIDRCHLHFALGKALEDQGRYAEAFAAYASGNRLKKATSRYRPETIEQNTTLQIRYATHALFQHHAHGGCPDPSPIFIVGLPRSGSTLIEQILASHSQIEGTMELADVPRIVAGLQGRDSAEEPRYPRLLTVISDEELRALGERYIRDTRIYRVGKARFIDKMPNNFRHIGLIHLMLPRAKIIDARREPMPCCFSNFKQLFAHGQEFTYSLEDIARYYRTYVELMDHWDRVLPGVVLRVQYEQLVGDLEGQVRRLLEYLNLPFEPACLAFHRNTRSVRTASSEQVRQPLFADANEQWRHFEPYLGELRAALGSVEA